MRISLVRCPCVNLPYPPSVGLAYINSFLKNAGHEVFIFDLNIELFHSVNDDKRKIWNIPDVPSLIKLSEEVISDFNDLLNNYIKKILETGTTLIGFSVWDSNSLFSLRVAQEIKKIDRNITIVFGGPECFPRWSGKSLIKEDCVDIVVYGEGEDSLKELINYLELTGRIGLHPGTIVKRNSDIIDCGSREPIKDLDNMPFPDFDGFPLDKYMTNEFPIIFSRGCARKCTYCSLPGTTPQYRWRSANSIYEEIKYQLHKYPHIDSFHSASPALNSNLKELSKLCDLIIRDSLKISWSGFAVIDKGMDLSLLKKMKKAGCSCLNFGIENGSQSVIDKMRKGFRIEDAEQNICDAYNLGIEVVANFIIGFPGENEEDFQQTLDFISRNQQYISSIGSMDSCWIGPYTYLYDHPEEFGLVINYDTNLNSHNWSCKESNYLIRKTRKDKFRDFINSLNIRNTFSKLPYNS
ncbi:MAG: radical SAM protein [Candidatus Omnitrophota bacterium]